MAGRLDGPRRAELLRFATERPALPAGSGPVMTLALAPPRPAPAGGGAGGALPVAHTCFGRLELPDSGTAGQLEAAFRAALEEWRAGAAYSAH